MTSADLITGVTTELYFTWLCDMVEVPNKYSRLMRFLHDTDFEWFIPKDENRAMDGLTLRVDFMREHDTKEYPGKSSTNCSVLEMMIALARRCDRDYTNGYLEDSTIKDWFWDMIKNLHLDNMTNSNFNLGIAQTKINTLLSRDYKPNGDGGLFTIKEKNADVRDLEIWKQLMWYLSERI